MKPATRRKYKEIQMVANMLLKYYSLDVVERFVESNYFVGPKTLANIIVEDLKAVGLETPSIVYATVYQAEKQGKLGINLKTQKPVLPSLF